MEIMENCKFGCIGYAYVPVQHISMKEYGNTCTAVGGIE